MRTKIKRLLSTGIILAASAALSLPAVAGGGKEKGQSIETGQEKQSHKNKVSDKEKQASREVSGQVVQTKTVEVRGTDTKNLIAMVKTKKANKNLVIDLGPQEQFSDQQITQGMTLAAQGPVKDIRGRQFLVANKVKVGDKVMNIDRSAQSKQHKSSKQQES